MRKIKMPIKLKFRKLLILVVPVALGILLGVPSTVLGACSCSSMDIISGGGPQIICSDEKSSLVTFRECERKEGAAKGGDCPNNTYKFICPVGENVQTTTTTYEYVRFGFKVSSTLSSGSTLSDCKYGQGLQMTITSNKPVTYPVTHQGNIMGKYTKNAFSFNIDPTKGINFPLYGDSTASSYNYGSDNYITVGNKDTISGYDATTRNLTWWDNTDQTKGLTEMAMWNYRFVSYVVDSNDTLSCACTLEVRNDWTGTSPSITENKVCY